MNVTVWKCPVETMLGIEPESWEVHDTYRYVRLDDWQPVIRELLRDGYMIRVAPWTDCPPISPPK